jgi:adenylate cyclase
VARRDRDVPDDRRLAYRIGINIGDIIADGDDIYGDGVNVAARLEGLAVPGGICVSGAVHAQVKGKVELDFEDRGEQAVKNIPEPVRVFHFAPGGPTSAAAATPRRSRCCPSPTCRATRSRSISPTASART